MRAGVFHIEGDLALHTVQVVVQARRSIQKQRRGNAVQIEGGTEGIRKEAVDRADGPLGIVGVKNRPVAGRDKYMTLKIDPR